MLSDVTVVKVGGREVDDPAWVGRLSAAVAPLAPLVLVHGGGREVSLLQERLGLVPEWRDGLRVTDAGTLAVVSMVLSGLVNKRLVSALVGAGVRSVGVSGEDDGLLRAEPAAGGTLGHTGRVVAVGRDLLGLLLGAGITAVVSPLCRGPGGGALNVNADDAASAIASAVGARRLLFISDVPGVTLPEGVVPSLPADRIEGAIATGAVNGGMVPKLRAAARAAADVPVVRIGGLDLLSGGAGTRVVATAERAA
ncbi:MAG: acetylglutamate kinase [Gemmatimonadetes bacterium]|nr:acetylglutamate kinase [Gemmatimonadota bacterium]